MSRFCPEVFTNNNPSNTILVTFSTARFWVCGFTNHADLSNLHQAVPYMTEVKGLLTRACTPKMPSPCLHPCAIIAPMCHAFKMQPELHNSAYHSISKFVYLCLRLVVVCIYPQPPIWPWLWGYTYLYLPYPCVQCFWILNGCYEVSSYRPIHAPFFVLLFNLNCSQFNKLKPWVHHLLRVWHLSWGPELIIRLSTRDKDWGGFWKGLENAVGTKKRQKVPSRLPCFP